jgi:hypothetical protein
MWNDSKRDECCDLYLNLAISLGNQLKTPAIKSPLSIAHKSAKDQSKRRGAVIMRKALDSFLAVVDDVSLLLHGM